MSQSLANNLGQLRQLADRLECAPDDDKQIVRLQASHLWDAHPLPQPATYVGLGRGQAQEAALGLVLRGPAAPSPPSVEAADGTFQRFHLSADEDDGELLEPLSRLALFLWSCAEAAIS